MSQSDIVTQIQVNNELKEPPMFKVIYLNDNTAQLWNLLSNL